MIVLSEAGYLLAMECEKWDGDKRWMERSKYLDLLSS
jgi:hypothetical protein